MSAKENAYTKAFKKHKGSIKSLMWKSYASASTRYKELTRDIDFDNKSVLDVGCGFGDIIPFISCKSTSFEYTGIDLTGEFSREAKKRYPDYTFLEGDYFKNPLSKKFDIIICCGALNGNYGKRTLETRRKAIKTMFNHCKKAVAFNMAGGISPENKKGSMIFYADFKDILGYCVKLSKKVILRNHYHEKDFTIIIMK
jgi:SAM-dependent methyltransferase